MAKKQTLNLEAYKAVTTATLAVRIPEMYGDAGEGMRILLYGPELELPSLPMGPPNSMIIFQRITRIDFKGIPRVPGKHYWQVAHMSMCDYIPLWEDV